MKIVVALLLIGLLIAGMMDKPDGPYDLSVMPDVNAHDSGLFVDSHIFEDGSYYLDINFSLTIGGNGCLPFHIWDGELVDGACMD